MDSKEELRKLAKLKRLNVKNKENKEKIITKKLLENKYIRQNKNILVYISREDEVSTKNLITSLLKLQKNVYVPKVINKEMEFYQISEITKFQKSKFGIKEPVDGLKFNDNSNSVVIVPGLLFDRNNNRIGYGGGYYDKFLINKSYYKIGVCFSDFLMQSFEVDIHDIKMDLVITEK